MAEVECQAELALLPKARRLPPPLDSIWTVDGHGLWTFAGCRSDDYVLCVIKGSEQKNWFCRQRDLEKLLLGVLEQ